MKVPVLILILILTGARVFSAAAQEPAAGARNPNAEWRELQEALAPLVKQAIEDDEALAELQKEVRLARMKAYQANAKLQAKAMEQLVNSHPDLADTVVVIKEMEGGLRDLIKRRREGDEGAMEEYNKARTELNSLRATLRPQVEKLMQESDELKAAADAIKDQMAAAKEMERSFNEQVDAKLVEMSPEAKARVEQRRALVQRAQQGRGLGEKERREKFEALRQRARELDKELMPVRRKAMGDPQVREAWAEAQRLSIEANEATYRKMAELAPDLAEAIEERKKVQEEMTSAWRGRRGKKQ